MSMVEKIVQVKTVDTLETVAEAGPFRDYADAMDSPITASFRKRYPVGEYYITYPENPHWRLTHDEKRGILFS